MARLPGGEGKWLVCRGIAGTRRSGIPWLCEWVDKPGSVVERSFISNVRCRTPQARNPNARKGSRVALLFALAPDGVFQATPLPTCWCALTAPFQLFPCSPRAVGEFSFLWHFPSGHPAQPLAGILPLGARTFLAPKHAIAWPTRDMVFYHIGWIICRSSP